MYSRVKLIIDSELKRSETKKYQGEIKLTNINKRQEEI